MTEKYKCHLAVVGVHIGVGTEEHDLTGDECRDLLNELSTENRQLKAQLSVDIDEGVCNICKHQQLIPHKDVQGYYTAKCEKGYLQCSKSSLRYCEDFELKEFKE